jgi:hypothetical protein
VVKRVLAIRADWVWTPWQLFGHLLRTRTQSWRCVSASQTARDELPRTVI